MRRRRSLADFFRRLLAGGLAALVFALTIFAASPVAHDLLHKQDAPRADDRCAVVLFAGGVALPLGPIELVQPAAAWRAPSASIVEEIFVSSPRYLRQPERGPPGGAIA
jgi:hypothetical protein